MRLYLIKHIVSIAWRKDFGVVGTGKTHLATALALELCEQGRQTRFFTAAGLANQLIESTVLGEVTHTGSELSALVKQLKKLRGETEVIMEYTGTYYHPIAYELYEAGIFVSMLHAQLIARSLAVVPSGLFCSAVVSQIGIQPFLPRE